MIKCPKCQFTQPPDTYCANCGVNMETYRPKPRPLFQTLLGHWLFHLSVIIVIIVSFVLYNSGDPQPKNVSAVPQAQNETKSFQTSVPAANPAPRAQPALAAEPQALAKKEETVAMKTADAVPESLPAEIGVKMGTRTHKKNAIHVSFYRATKNAFSELQREAQSGSFNGEATGGIIDKKKVSQLVASKEMRLVESDTHKEYDSQHPIMIFKGQRSSMTGKNIGLYFQIVPIKYDAGSLQMEIRSWGNLKTQGSEENLFISEMTVNLQAGAYIAGFLPKDRPFTDEEKMVFESDKTLKIYNTESFWEGNSDLIMVVELTEGAG